MRCWRIDLRRNFGRYLNRELEPGAIRRLEDHLLDCSSCRTSLAHLRNGHRLAQEMPRFNAPPEGWSALETVIDGRDPVVTVNRATGGWRGGVRKPGFIFAVIGIATLLASIFVASARHTNSPDPATVIANALDLSEFHLVNIGEIEHNSRPHVVAEGYVSELRVNDEDGDLSFKLVDDLANQETFIVCEIIDPIRLKAPTVGSRVRVYGVSRYDSQTNHNWYEVHPVLNIEVVPR